MSLNNLSNEVLLMIMERGGMSNLTAFLKVSKRFRNLSLCLLTKKLPYFKVSMAILQGDKHMCPRFQFHSFDQERIYFKVIQSVKVQFDTGLLIHDPMIRYLKLIHPNYIAKNLALSKPINLKINQIGEFERQGYNKEVKINYKVHANKELEILSISIDLKLFDEQSVHDELISIFPPASLVEWIPFKFKKYYKKDRFTSAIPMYPIFPRWRRIQWSAILSALPYSYLFV